MNANELANKLEDGETEPMDALEAAAMLRQLQHRIEELEAMHEYLYKVHDSDKSEIVRLKAKLELEDEDIEELIKNYGFNIPKHCIGGFPNETYILLYDLINAALRKAQEK